MSVGGDASLRPRARPGGLRCALAWNRGSCRCSQAPCRWPFGPRVEQISAGPHSQLCRRSSTGRLRAQEERPAGSPARIGRVFVESGEVCAEGVIVRHPGPVLSPRPGQVDPPGRNLVDLFWRIVAKASNRRTTSPPRHYRRPDGPRRLSFPPPKSLPQ